MKLHLLSAAVLALAAVPAHGQTAGADTVVFEADALTVPPRPVNVAEFVAALDAAYPQGLRGAGTPGTVHARFVVGPDGVPGRVTITSSTDTAFHAPARAALAVLRFAPAEIDGRPVATWAEIPLQWAPPTPDPAVATDLEAVDDDSTYTLQELDQPPRPLNLRDLLRRMEAAYPVALRESRLQGEVLVRMRVSSTGVPGSFSILRSSHVAFNRPAIDVLAHLRFTPGRLDGRDVAAWLELPIQWTVTR